jgi:hypothetical protein
MSPNWLNNWKGCLPSVPTAFNQPWEGILEPLFDKRLESSAPCYSQLVLLADFSSHYQFLRLEFSTATADRGGGVGFPFCLFTFKTTSLKSLVSVCFNDLFILKRWVNQYKNEVCRFRPYITVHIVWNSSNSMYNPAVLYGTPYAPSPPRPPLPGLPPAMMCWSGGCKCFAHTLTQTSYASVSLYGLADEWAHRPHNQK